MTTLSTGIISPNHFLPKNPLLGQKTAWHPSCQAAFIEDKPRKRVSHATQSECFGCTHSATASAGLAARRDRGTALRAAVVRHVAREFSRYSRSCEVSQIEIWTTFGVKVRNWGEGVRSNADGGGVSKATVTCQELALAVKGKARIFGLARLWILCTVLINYYECHKRGPRSMLPHPGLPDPIPISRQGFASHRNVSAKYPLMFMALSD